jgi:hypothetical protein
MDVVILNGGINWQTKFLSRSIGPYKISRWLEQYGYKCQVIDFCDRLQKNQLDSLLNKFVSTNTAILAVSTTFLANKIYAQLDDNIVELLKKYKELYPNIKIVAGGWLSELIPSYNVIDATVMSYESGTEDVMFEYLQYVRKKGQAPIGTLIFGPDKKARMWYKEARNKKYNILHDAFKFTDSDGILYGEPLPLDISRGCIFACKFCSFLHTGKKKYDYVRGLDLIEDELRYNYEKFGTTNYYILDDTFNDTVQKISEFTDITRRLSHKIQYTAYIRADLIHRFPESADLLFESGIKGAIFGIESLHPEASKIIGKAWSGKHAVDFIPKLHHDNWKNQVTLGIKSKGGERLPFSSILIRNLDEGNNEEAIAGTKPRRLIIDEIGKGSFLRGLQAAIPGFTTPFGWGCSPILTGTGGDMKMFMDAKSLMFDVENFNFLEYNNAKDEKRIHGLFISHKYRMEAKEPSTLGAYLDAPKKSCLHDVGMMVSNEEKATEITNTNLEKLKKAGDRMAYLKEKMYYPQEVDDIFLNEDTNIFDIEAAKRQKARLLNQERTGTPVILYDDGQGVKHEFTDKLPISNFPLKNTDRKDAPVIIYEFPIDTPPYGLYVAGVDPYRQGKSAYSSSLGSVYIYKRMHSISGEKYQDMFVASYCARPDKKETWEEQARLLIKYYNARTLCENDEISFIDYMISKGDQHYLERQPDWLKEIVPNTTVRRDFGIHRSAEKIRDFLHGCLKKYTEESIHIEKDADGNIISETKGMSKIFDPVLLEEMIQYNEQGNFDRIIAAELAIALAMKLDPIMGKIGGEQDVRIQSMFKKNKKNTLFTESRTMFNTPKKNKLFI